MAPFVKNKFVFFLPLLIYESGSGGSILADRQTVIDWIQYIGDIKVLSEVSCLLKRNMKML
jgi:hypothetical protein